MAYDGLTLPVVAALTAININGAATGTTLIGTTSNTMRFVPLFISVEPTAISGIISVSSFCIGTNSPSYANILGISILTGATSPHQVSQFPAVALVSSIAPATPVYINITTAAIASSYTLRVSLIGFYY